MLLASPNPGRGTVRFLVASSIRGRGPFEIEIVDARGRLVRRLTGSAPILWDGKDGDGRAAASGAYLAWLCGRALPVPFVLAR